MEDKWLFRSKEGVRSTNVGDHSVARTTTNPIRIFFVEDDNSVSCLDKDGRKRWNSENFNEEIVDIGIIERNPGSSYVIASGVQGAKYYLQKQDGKKIREKSTREPYRFVKPVVYTGIIGIPQNDGLILLPEGLDQRNSRANPGLSQAISTAVDSMTTIAEGAISAYFAEKYLLDSGTKDAPEAQVGDINIDIDEISIDIEVPLKSQDEKDDLE